MRGNRRDFCPPLFPFKANRIMMTKADKPNPTVATAFDVASAADLLDKILTRLRAARRVQVIGHVRPDGDCVGSMLTMHQLLTRWGIAHRMAAEKIACDGYAILEGFDQITETADASFKPDLIVFVDCASFERGLGGWQATAPIINIDHHTSNTLYGEINWIEPRCASVGEMLFHLITHASEPITPALADNMLLSLTTDTGSFKFSNTGPAQHRVAAQLIEAGASVEAVTRMAYGSQHPSGVQLAGHVMSTMHLECNGKLVWGEIKKETYQQFGGEDKAPENLVDALRSILGVELSLLFHEIKDGSLRLNLRSNGRINVSKLAHRWGGGGHPCASGLTVHDADYTVDRDRILAEIIEEVDRTLS